MDRISLLIAHAADASVRPFRPGRHDCALFAAGWVKIATGRDFARGWRGRYRSLRRGQELLAGVGFADHIALAAAHLPEIAPAMAQIGTIGDLYRHFRIDHEAIVTSVRHMTRGAPPR